MPPINSHISHRSPLTFADGTAQLLPDPDLPKLFAASNAARAKLHLPPFTLDGPPPKPVPQASHSSAGKSPS